MERLTDIPTTGAKKQAITHIHTAQATCGEKRERAACMVALDVQTIERHGAEPFHAMNKYGKPKQWWLNVTAQENFDYWLSSQ